MDEKVSSKTKYMILATVALIILLIIGIVAFKVLGEKPAPSDDAEQTDNEAIIEDNGDSSGDEFEFDEPEDNTAEEEEDATQEDETTDRKTETVETQTTLTSKEKCEKAGGIWKYWRDHPEAVEECNMPTSDGGKQCIDSNECESYCEAPEGSKTGDAVAGTCYGYEMWVCMTEVISGKVQPTICQ